MLHGVNVITERHAVRKVLIAVFCNSCHLAKRWILCPPSEAQIPQSGRQGPRIRAQGPGLMHLTSSTIQVSTLCRMPLLLFCHPIILLPPLLPGTIYFLLPLSIHITLPLRKAQLQQL